ncbi:MAG: type toxin-antitoxin system mRNA interferase toxin, RelE/StbE family [Sphingomonas bacterium]|uniref:type II toxin-antitoxin system RelE/ParE family toxin n=1 Tax=Sphingomonas bacterium TaxID=1895847 RepID=UPI0026177E83|nr:type II toxin-antitoxin system RelE/ParE family toxin [Sphingomonas bacterium]MDB5709614.1 type toxin-antitoxin system mRNA interferase toxin, RelE/StbE family [Sphingomonas bacterium]
MKLVWSALSRADRREIYAYIEADNPRAAIAVDKRIEAVAWRLIDFPESGRIGRVEGTRELVVGRTPYILPYVIADDVVRILRVIHGARLWPENFTDDESA